MNDTGNKTADRARSERLGHRMWWPWHGHGHFGWVVHPALVGLCVGVAFFAASLSVTAADVWVTLKLQSVTSLRGVMEFVSWFGYLPQSLLMSVLGTVFVLAVWGRWAGVWCAITLAGASLLSTLIKLVIHRPRPTTALVQVVQTNGGYSFPSGHVLNYTVFFGLLLIFAWTLPGAPLWRAVVTVPSIFMIVMVGPSRIYLGAHWTSDVLGAYFLGAAWLSVMVTIAHNHLADRFHFPFQAATRGKRAANIAKVTQRSAAGGPAGFQQSRREGRESSQLEHT